MKVKIFRNTKTFDTYAAGQTIFEKGDPGACMFAVVEGEVAIMVDGQEIDRLEEGEIFGEMALVDDSPRSATAVAVSDVKVVPVDRKRFEYLVSQTPFFALQVLSIMAERLRRHMAAGGK